MAYILAIYISLYLIKLFVTRHDYARVVDNHIKHGRIRPQDGESFDSFRRKSIISMAVGAALSLTVFVLPLLWMERLRFFAPYPVVVTDKVSL